MSVSRVQTNSLAIQVSVSRSRWVDARAFREELPKTAPRASKEGQLSQP